MPSTDTHSFFKKDLTERQKCELHIYKDRHSMVHWEIKVQDPETLNEIISLFQRHTVISLSILVVAS